MNTYIFLSIIIILIIVILWLYNRPTTESQLLEEKQVILDEIESCTSSKELLLLEQVKLKGDVEENNSKISKLVEERDANIQKIDSITSTIKQLQVNTTDGNTRVEIQELEADNNTLSSKVNTLNESIKELINDRKIKAIQISESLSEINILETKIKALNEHITKLDADIIKLTGKNMDLTQQNTSLSDKINTLQTDNNILQDEQNKLKGEISNLLIQRQALESKVLECDESNENNVMQITELESKITDIDNNIKTLTSSLRDLDFVIVDMGCDTGTTSTVANKADCWQKCKDTVCKFASYNTTNKSCNISSNYPSNCTFGEGVMTYIKT